MHGKYDIVLPCKGDQAINIYEILKVEHENGRINTRRNLMTLLTISFLERFSWYKDPYPNSECIYDCE
jgi:hypothetical protein